MPWRVEAITPEWLTARVCSEHEGARVESIDVRGKGDMGSTVHRWLTVRYNDAGRRAGLPEAMFVKSTPTVLSRLASGGRVVTQEYTFFSVARPELDIETPTLLVSAIDNVSGRSIQIFDDLVATKGVEFYHRDTVVTRTAAEGMVDTLAAYHRAFWDSPRFADDLSALPRHGGFLEFGKRVGMVDSHNEAMHKAADVIPPGVFAKRDRIWADAEQTMSFHTDGPRTLLHGDMHLGNWYETRDHVIGLADWQNTCTGSWAFDFAYTVSTTLDVEDRRAWEKDLLSRYLENLRQDLSVDTAWEMYRRALNVPLLLWTPTLVPSPVFPDMQSEEMSMLMIQRISTAMDDLGTLEEGGHA
ncbi:aminoglycoside phosphotransferase family protein [Nocardioides sp.]|uniref:aminoglycoside phosphotransferase family protein n=1 Tax=Nocardioides sp. TaxID=35761 RepID=UPI002621E285|nr:aminoglycoside phosphotransferase family protein [Nocardioides sp.]MDI6909225.1 aminoglycoside phosphotransferase family protein [Nocardioides sp.]